MPYNMFMYHCFYLSMNVTQFMNGPQTTILSVYFILPRQKAWGKFIIKVMSSLAVKKMHQMSIKLSISPTFYVRLLHQYLCSTFYARLYCMKVLSRTFLYLPFRQNVFCARIFAQKPYIKCWWSRPKKACEKLLPWLA